MNHHGREVGVAYLQQTLSKPLSSTSSSEQPPFCLRRVDHWKGGMPVPAWPGKVMQQPSGHDPDRLRREGQGQGPSQSWRLDYQLWDKPP